MDRISFPTFTCYLPWMVFYGYIYFLVKRWCLETEDLYQTRLMFLYILFPTDLNPQEKKNGFMVQSRFLDLIPTKLLEKDWYSSLLLKEDLLLVKERKKRSKAVCVCLMLWSLPMWTVADFSYPTDKRGARWMTWENWFRNSHIFNVW